MQNSIYKIKYLLFLSKDWEAWCLTQPGGGVLPPQTVKHHASQSQDRNNKYFILYIEFCINNKI